MHLSKRLIILDNPSFNRANNGFPAGYLGYLRTAQTRIPHGQVTRQHTVLYQGRRFDLLRVQRIDDHV
jgi:hypothetical protein